MNNLHITEKSKKYILLGLTFFLIVYYLLGLSTEAEIAPTPVVVP